MSDALLVSSLQTVGRVNSRQLILTFSLGQLLTLKDTRTKTLGWMLYLWMLDGFRFFWTTIHPWIGVSTTPWYYRWVCGLGMGLDITDSQTLPCQTVKLVFLY